MLAFGRPKSRTKFYYDTLNRLDHSALNGTTNLQMAYDATGNITSKSDVSSSLWTYDTTHIHQVRTAGSSAYTYDANGNMLTFQASSAPVVWSSYNYPTSIKFGTSSEAIDYGPDRQRYHQVYVGPSGTETTTYIGSFLEKVLQTSGATDWRHTVYAGSEPVAIVARQDSGTLTTRINYILKDHQGSVAAFVNSAGSTVVNESFRAYGVGRSPVDWSSNTSTADAATISKLSRRAYTFESSLSQPGTSGGMLIDLNGRVLDGLSGRLFSADPFISDPTNTQNYNRYSYVNNNPLSFTDPSGFASECFDSSYTVSDDIYWNSEYNMWEVGSGYTVHEHTCFDIPEPTFPPPGSPPGTPHGPPSAPPPPPPPGSPPYNTSDQQQGNQQQDPCSSAGNAPSPQEYEAQGAALQQQNNLLNGLDPKYGPVSASGNSAGALLDFRRGRALDAQVLYGGSPAYANYVFGVYLSAAGYSLQDTLGYANTYAYFRSTYGPSVPMATPNYPSTPAANVANITTGFNAQQNGTLCTKPK